MKRFFSMILILLLLLSLCACTAEPQETEPVVETQPECQHSWTEATCSSPKACSLCGIWDGAALEHTWKNGVCTVCQKKDYAYNPLMSGTWLYLTKEKWKILDFHKDGTCDIQNVNGMPTNASTLEEAVSKGVANLQRQYKDNWEYYAAQKYFVLKIRDYYYVANMTFDSVEYTSDGKNIVMEQEGFLPFYVEMHGAKTIKESITGDAYVNFEVEYISSLLMQYNKLQSN